MKCLKCFFCKKEINTFELCTATVEGKKKNTHGSCWQDWIDSNCFIPKVLTKEQAEDEARRRRDSKYGYD